MVDGEHFWAYGWRGVGEPEGSIRDNKPFWVYSERSFPWEGGGY